MPFVEDQHEDQAQQPQGKSGFVPDEEAALGSTGDKLAASGAVGGGALALSMILRRRFPGYTGRAVQSFLDRLNGSVSSEITKGGLPALGAEYRQFINSVGRDNPNYMPTFADFLAHKGVQAPETMKLIQQTMHAGPSTPSEIAGNLVKRDEGAQQRALDSYVTSSTPSQGGAMSIRLRPDFWKQNPDDLADTLEGMPPEHQAALQDAVRASLSKMPYRQFARRFLGTDPAYAQDRAILSATLPQDARTAFIKSLTAEQMMHRGAVDFTAPGSVPGSGVMGNPVDEIIAAHDAMTGGFHPLSWAIRAIRGSGPDKPELRAGNRALFSAPDADIEPGVGVTPGSYSNPSIDAYSPQPWWKPGALDAGVGAGAGALNYGLEDQQDQAQ